MPSRLGYIASGLLVLSGVVLSMVWTIAGMTKVEGKYQRFVVPGTHRLEIDEPGVYDISYEYRSAVDGTIFSTSRDLPSIRCSVASAAGEKEGLTLRQPVIATEYSFGRYAGIRLYKFEVDQPGTYTLHVEYLQPAATEPIVLSVAPGGAGQLVEVFLAPCATMGIMVPAGFLWATVLFLKRRRATAALAG